MEDKHPTSRRNGVWDLWSQEPKDLAPGLH